MQRKTLFLIIIIFAFLAGAGLFGFYYYLNRQASNSPYGNSFSLQNFFPFGQSNSSSNSSSNNNIIVGSNSGTSTNSSLPYPILRHITIVPVSGSIMLDRQTISTTSTSTIAGTLTKTEKINKTYIRYMERGTGQTYETLIDDLTTNRISNTTFPKIYSASFNASGSSTILMSVQNDNSDIVNTYYGNLSKNASTSSSTPTNYNLNTILLSDHATEVVVSPDKKSIFTLLTIPNNPGIISNFDGTKQSTIWTSPISEWIPYWATNKYIVMTTKPSFGVAGFSYLVNISTGKYSHLLGDVDGLTVLPSPDLSFILYSNSNSTNPLSLSIYNVKNKSSQDYSLKTLPEKCVWSSLKTPLLYCAIPGSLPNASYPDDWYKGVISFSDSIWSINLTTGESKRIAALSQLAGQNIDATNLSLDSKEDYLTFVNKNDLTLWGLQLAPTASTSTATTTKK